MHRAAILGGRVPSWSDSLLMLISTCVAAPMALLSLITVAPAVVPPPPPVQMAEGAESSPSELLRTIVIGKTLSGADIEATVLAAGEQPLEDRRGLLVVAGMDGRRVQDQEILARTLAHLSAREDLSELLGDDMLVFVQHLNRSGLPNQSMGDESHSEAVEGNRRSLDNDRDGRLDEDAPSDLDGDGEITWMRVPDGAGEWVLDEHDGRAMRKARRERGERGTHRLIREGLDDDGDGAWHEDAGSGVILNANFPHGWDEYPADTGAYPLSEPETRALVDFVLTHPGLLGVVVLGEEDTLVSVPKAPKPGEKPDRSGWGGGFRKALDGLMKEDVESLKELHRRLEELSEDPHEVKADGPVDGGFLAWVYHQGGRWPLGLSPWSVPDSLRKPDDEEASPGQGAEPGSHGTDEQGDDTDDAMSKEDKSDKKEDREEDTPSSDEDSPVSAAVLEWLDDHRGGVGFVDWTPYDHPQLGDIEIGGLTQQGSLTAGRVQEDLDVFADQLSDVLLATLDWFPVVALEDLEITRHGEGLYTIEVAVVNTGVLPTSTQLGADARISRPIRVRLQLPPGVERMFGPQQKLVRRLDGGGGREKLRWMIAGGATGTQLALLLDADSVNDLELKVVLP